MRLSGSLLEKKEFFHLEFIYIYIGKNGIEKFGMASQRIFIDYH